MLGSINGINFKVMTMIRKTCFTAAMSIKKTVTRRSGSRQKVATQKWCFPESPKGRGL
jgi:hypothetical protein